MADTAAWLVDRVIPDVPVRQWVLSLPHRVRYACAFDHHIAQGVRKILVRAIASFYRRAVSTKDMKAKAGAILGW